ncbi:disease resistance protein Pik-1-like [Lolium rigidum]|uniref:disease resistance protein Pik-1-like n=1 Tax=Lolium rigidum TaxID=89674 RepID=UPI001F5C25B4|nr:disease resistance protein Pik-1-like [Lolium rigidum]
MEKSLVTAATGALGPVIAKLAALLGREYKLRWRTRRDIKFIKSKLKSVHSLLWTICESELLDAASKELKMEALDLADDMEDAIDDFIVSMERSRSSKPFVQTKGKASPLQDFKKRVTAVSERCSGMWKKKISSSPSRPTPRARPFVRKEASELVPMDRQMDVLIRVLVGTEDSILVEPKLKMASILGTAGMGKTTLADLIYQAIGNRFQARGFVSVTPGGNITEVLARILEEVADENSAPFPDTEAATEQDHLINKISYFLRDRRYLVIIDDIWDWGEWEIINKSLPENNLGSRIITTTRVNSIAEKWRCYSKTRLHKMDLQYQGQIWEYDTDVDVGSRMIAMKAEMDGEGFDYEHVAVCMCGGVPLPLVCMFSVVAIESPQTFV